MISFEPLDYIIIISFFIILIVFGFAASKQKSVSSDDYLLSGRKVGLILFILTNVATWYGGILGVGEFSFRYGLASWVTQGLPYYIFAILFAYFFAERIRSANLFTIPDKLSEVYGKKVGLISAILIFILVSPAPYLAMMGQILSIIFDIDYFSALIISSIVSSAYLFRGGYKSNIWADAFSFFIMFGGFIAIVLTAYLNFGGIDFLSQNLPPTHLTATGGNSFIYIFVWFLIALWTFTDPGFHQRCYSAKSGSIAKWGILISVIFWIFFDFLTNVTGLYSKAILIELDNPVMAFPYLANRIMSPALKGLFFAALIATVLSTLNSFLFLSATTFSRDFIFRMYNLKISESKNIGISQKKSISNLQINFTKLGLIVTLIISIIIAFYFQSVVQIWYSIGSVCIPGLILLVISSYYPQIKISKNIALLEILFGITASVMLFLFRYFSLINDFLNQLEPMILGLIIAFIIHVIGVYLRKNST